MLKRHHHRENNELSELSVLHYKEQEVHALVETQMPHAIQSRQTGGPEVLIWTPIEVPEPGSGQVRLRQAAAGPGPALAMLPPTSPPGRNRSAAVRAGVIDRMPLMRVNRRYRIFESSPNACVVKRLEP